MHVQASATSSWSVSTPQMKEVSTTSLSFSFDTSDATSVSMMSQFFKRVQSLAQSDSADFKEVATKAASQLTDFANSASDPETKQQLQDLAKMLTGASTSAAPSAVKALPSDSPASAPDAPAPVSTPVPTFDPADANRDGTVSDAERRAFDANRAYGTTMSAVSKQTLEVLLSSLNSMFDAFEQALSKRGALLAPGAPTTA